MILLLMLHLLMVGTLAAVAGWAGEAALRRLHLPARGVWAAALMVTIVVPLLAASRQAAVAPGDAGADPAIPSLVITDAMLQPPGGTPGGGLLAAVMEIPEGLVRLEPYVLLLWSAAAALGLVRLFVGHAWLRRRREGWPAAEVLGARVRVAPGLGPAVAGLTDAAIILPDWALKEPPRAVRLMLAHEREHLRARDPWLLALADVAVALAPWHPALHWQRARLRLAVELDCDARVLRSHGDARAYAELLLHAARRQTRVGHPLASSLALAPRPSTLERRISAMTENRPKRPAAALACAGAAGMLFLLACEAPRPTAPLPESEVPISAIVRQADRVPEDSAVVIQGSSVVALHRDAPDSGEARTALLRDLLVTLRDNGELVEGQPLVALYQEGSVLLRPVKSLDSLGIDPNSIESIEVVKGSAAERLYGPDAKDGVISILRRDTVAAHARARAVAVRKDTIRADTLARGELFAAMRNMREAAVAVRPGADDAAVITLPRSSTEPQPLYIVDGIVVNNPEFVRQLNPGTIESVEVIKGTAAARLYGSRGANGVIVIHLKGGGR